MTILLLALPAAFTAFCVWLTVRIVNRRERWAKRTLVATVGFPVLYIASFGPACWIWSRTAVMYSVYDVAYRPLEWAADRIPSASIALEWYATVGMPEPSALFLPGTDPDDPHYFTKGDIHLQIDRPLR